ncbi:MAG: hypothetical protein F6J87_10455 [Spirulina sp. SIO3F2]|nr:hypothetical protein [Spirulina sp. SIO3F2]
MDNLLKGTLCIANGVILAGIVGAALARSDRAFDLSFWLRGWRQVHQPPDAALTQLVSHTPCIPNPQATTFSAQQAQDLQVQLAQGARFRSLTQVMETLGTPACQVQTSAGIVLTYPVSDRGQLLIGATRSGITVAWQP